MEDSCYLKELCPFEDMSKSVPRWLYPNSRSRYPTSRYPNPEIIQVMPTRKSYGEEILSRSVSCIKRSAPFLFIYILQLGEFGHFPYMSHVKFNTGLVPLCQISDIQHFSQFCMYCGRLSLVSHSLNMYMWSEVRLQ